MIIKALCVVLAASITPIHRAPTLTSPTCSLDVEEADSLEPLRNRFVYSKLSQTQVVRLARNAAKKWKTELKGFKFVKVERFAVGEVAFWIALWKHKATGLEFSLVPGGFVENRTSFVKLDPFLICRTECTQDAWAEVATSTRLDPFPSVFEGPPGLPVEHVNWNQVTSWCESTNLQLPTSQQWIFACRGGVEGAWAMGNEKGSLRQYGNIGTADIPGESRKGKAVEDWSDGYGAETAPVGSFKPNSFGLLDVHGNVAEWCRDSHKKGAKLNPEAGTGRNLVEGRFRVFRGGAFRATAASAKTVKLYHYTPNVKKEGIGFRPSRDLRFSSPRLRERSYVAPQALVAGFGDAFGDTQEISTCDLKQEGFSSIAELAGSWIQLRSVSKLTLAQLKKDAKFAQEHRGAGLVCFTVAREGKLPKGYSLAGNHFLWIFPRVSKDSMLGGPYLLDNSFPSSLVIDPAGLIVRGGARLPECGPAEEVWGKQLASLMRSSPGLSLSCSKAGSRLRDSIAKRNWKNAFKLTSRKKELRALIETMIETQVSWAEAALEQADPLAAEARLKHLGRMYSDNGWVKRIAAMKSGLKQDAMMKEARSQQLQILKVAEDLQSSKRMLQPSISDNSYKKLNKLLSAIEKKAMGPAVAAMTKSLRSSLESKSPFRPCKSCGKQIHTGGCKRG